MSGSRFFNSKLLGQGLSSMSSKMQSLGKGKSSSDASPSKERALDPSQITGKFSDDESDHLADEEESSVSSEDEGFGGHSTAAGTDHAGPDAAETYDNPFNEYQEKFDDDQHQQQHRGRRLSSMVSSVTDKIRAPGSNVVSKLDVGFQNLYGDVADLEKRCQIDNNNSSSTAVAKEEEEVTLQERALLAASVSMGGVKRTSDDVVQDLSPEYFTAEFDPVPTCVQEAGEWIHTAQGQGRGKEGVLITPRVGVLGGIITAQGQGRGKEAAVPSSSIRREEGDDTEDGSDGESAVQVQFMRRIEGLDVDRDLLGARLGDLVDSHYDEIMQCMTSVETISGDLTAASRQVGNSRGLVQRGAQALASGPMQVATLRRQVTRLEDVAAVAKSLGHVVSVHRAMERSIVTGDLGQAAECAYSLLHSLKHDGYDRFAALQGLPTKIQRSVYVIRRKADRALMRLSGRKFACREYESIVKCYLVLDWMEDSLGVQLVDHTMHSNSGEAASPPPSPFDHAAAAAASSALADRLPCIGGLADRVLSFQEQDVEKCLRTGVLEFIYASQQHKHAQQQQKQGEEEEEEDDDVDLEDEPLANLYPRVLPGLMIPCIVRSCELLIDVVHTHYLITQWHLAPFNANNEDNAWLHRSAIDLDDVVDDTLWGRVDDDDDDDDNDDDNDDDDDTIAVTIEGDKRDDDGESRASKGKKESDEERKDNDSNGVGAVEMAAAVTSALDAGSKEGAAATNTNTDNAAAPPPRAGTTTSTTSSRRLNGLLHSMRSPTRLRAATRESIVSSFCEHFDSGVVLRHVDAAAERERLLYLRGMQLSTCYQSLSRNRAGLWESLLEGLEGALSLVVLTSMSVSQSDFLHLSWALNAVIKLGKEFCGSESRRLHSCLESKSREYYRQVHGESFHILKEMIDNDTWRSVPVGSLQELGGIMGVVASSTPALAGSSNSGGGSGYSSQRTKRSMGLGSMLGLAFEAELGIFNSSRRDMTTAATSGGEEDGGEGKRNEEGATSACSTAAAAAAAPSCASIMVFCGMQGNPLHFMTDMIGCLSDNESEGNSSSEEEGEGGSVALNTPQKAAGAARASTSPPGVDVFRQLLTSSEPSSLTPQKQQGSSSSSSSSRRKSQLGGTDGQSACPVVTQAAFSGLTRCAGRYLQMMFLMPATAPTVFQGLCQLFDLYVCSVFTGFVSANERAVFFGEHGSSSSRMTSCALDYMGEFDSLREYLDRTLSAVVYYVRPAEQGRSSSSSSFVHDNVPLRSILMESWPHSQLHACDGSSSGSDGGGGDDDGDDGHGLLDASVVAAESLWFAASMLTELLPKVRRLLPPSYSATCDDFLANFQSSVTQLRALVYRTMCPELLRAPSFSQAIADGGGKAGWDLTSKGGKGMATITGSMSSLLPGSSSSSSGGGVGGSATAKNSADNTTEPCSAWVGEMVAACRRVWDHMNNNSDNNGGEAGAPGMWGSSTAPLVREQLWLELCQAAFDAAMEGFWRVRRVSQEGRRAMLRDARGLGAGLDQVHPCRCPRGLEHVEAVLEAAMTDSEDVMMWVQDHYTQYPYRHLLGLVTQTFSGALNLGGVSIPNLAMGGNQGRLRDATGFLDELFDEAEGESSSSGSSARIGRGGLFNSSSSSTSSSTNSSSSSSSSSSGGGGKGPSSSSSPSSMMRGSLSGVANALKGGMKVLHKPSDK